MATTHTWVDDTKEYARGHWREILVQLGVEVPATSHKHGACPGCGGKDRFRFDDKGGRGTFICSNGGGDPVVGDGFKLLEHAKGWRFMEAARRVADVLGVDRDATPLMPTRNDLLERRRVQLARAIQEEDQDAEKKERARKAVNLILSQCVPLKHVLPVWNYLQRRGLLERFVAGAENLMAHPGLPYYYRPSKDAKFQTLGTFPALIGVCKSASGQVVTLHRTWITPDGRKVELPDPDPNASQSLFLPSRKLMAVMDDVPYHIPLYAPHGEKLGVAEGIESAVASAMLNDVPVHSAIDSGKLIHYAPPVGVQHLYIFADPDPAGRHGAECLRDRLAIERPRMKVEIRYPPKVPGKPNADWNDVLLCHQQVTADAVNAAYPGEPATIIKFRKQ